MLQLSAKFVINNNSNVESNYKHAFKLLPIRNKHTLSIYSPSTKLTLTTAIPAITISINSPIASSLGQATQPQVLSNTLDQGKLSKQAKAKIQKEHNQLRCATYKAIKKQIQG